MLQKFVKAFVNSVFSSVIYELMIKRYVKLMLKLFIYNKMFMSYFENCITKYDCCFSEDTIGLEKLLAMEDMFFK